MSTLLLEMVQSIDEQTAQRIDALLLPLAEDMLWGTYGKGAAEAYQESGVPLPPVRWVRLGDCSTNHLEAIRRNIEEALAAQPAFYQSYHLSHMAAGLILANRKEESCTNISSFVSSSTRTALSWLRKRLSIGASQSRK